MARKTFTIARKHGSNEFVILHNSDEPDRVHRKCVKGMRFNMSSHPEYAMVQQAHVRMTLTFKCPPGGPKKDKPRAPKPTEVKVTAASPAKAAEPAAVAPQEPAEATGRSSWAETLLKRTERAKAIKEAKERAKARNSKE